MPLDCSVSPLAAWRRPEDVAPSLRLRAFLDIYILPALSLVSHLLVYLSSLSVFISTTPSVGALWPGSDTHRFHSQSVGKDDSRGRPQTRRQLGSGQRGAQGEEDVDFDDARALSATIVLSVIVRTTNNI